MAIRLRSVQMPDGTTVRVALCAVEADEMPGDVYLDDGDHYALAAKFARDRRGETITTVYPEEWAAMDTQKLRDAETELKKWIADGMPHTATTEPIHPRPAGGNTDYLAHHPRDGG